MGTIGKLSDAATDVVIGLLLHLSGGKNNVILGTWGQQMAMKNRPILPQSYDHRNPGYLLDRRYADLCGKGTKTGKRTYSRYQQC